MTAPTLAVRDSATMRRRSLKHIVRYPEMTVMLAGMPVIFLLLFVYVFGGTLGAGLGTPGGDRAAYLDYVVPGGHVTLRLADADGLRRAAAAVDGAIPDTAQLTLQVPSDGSVAALRHLLERLDSAAVAVDGLTVHTPDLDDVFLALTDATATRTKEPQR